ncbi:hypothetical protein NGC87_01600 [Staphylococcus pseudoxylosus]|nr:hypothetical protein [Staphylococcus pseudoxylosus]MDW8798725.1 hypothetical protein [Staphylococcus pseudoxylosus]MEB6035907.1 hypothetical protein [Staphylococcus pseudoxylosus]MEB6045200.1 hypothetical protein [Staphylococcus pseudoxylosus]MEB6059842.1 hypothetical protein [Staphylococcus pseudoxylosus]MEB7763020.1 hypothetical protein [Staphylococcus pseudoxylosus]
MKITFTVITIIFILLLPQIIRFARIKHMKSLGYRYEGDELVRIQTVD